MAYSTNVTGALLDRWRSPRPCVDAVERWSIRPTSHPSLKPALSAIPQPPGSLPDYRFRVSTRSLFPRQGGLQPVPITSRAFREMPEKRKSERKRAFNQMAIEFLTTCLMATRTSSTPIQRIASGTAVLFAVLQWLHLPGGRFDCGAAIEMLDEPEQAELRRQSRQLWKRWKALAVLHPIFVRE